MGASPNLRWVTIVVAASLAAAAPAGAQDPASPDAAPSASNAPRPDPAPVKTKPEATVVRTAPRPAAAVTTTVTPAAPVAKAPTRAASKPVRRAATHRKKAVRRQHPAKATPKRRARTVALSLPHLSLTHLTAPPNTGDAGRARRLAAGALSLLILALASATLLAFTARVERRRVAR